MPNIGKLRPSTLHLPESLVERAYLAGIYDGEGSVHWDLDNSRKHFSPRIHITNANVELMNWLLGMGGKVQELRRKTRRPSEKPVYNWRLTSSMNIKVFLEALIPFLRIKRKSAEVMLEAINKKIAEPAWHMPLLREPIGNHVEIRPATDWHLGR